MREWEGNEGMKGEFIAVFQATKRWKCGLDCIDAFIWKGRGEFLERSSIHNCNFKIRN
jgi:hypothetical protein